MNTDIHIYICISVFIYIYVYMYYLLANPYWIFDHFSLEPPFWLRLWLDLELVALSEGLSSSSLCLQNSRCRPWLQ